MKKELRQLVDKNCRMLEESACDFEAIYSIMFRLKDNVLCETEDGFGIRRYTYGEVEKMIESASSALHSRIGATHEYVALEMENCVEWIVAFWAILRSGNKPYLVNCRHPAALSQSIADTLNIKYTVTRGETRLSCENINIDTLSSEEPFGGEFENEIALSTSATTLREVVCFYTGSEMSRQILNTEDILKSSEQISKHYKGSLKQLAFLPFYHIFGLVAVYFWFTFFARTLVFMKDYSADTIVNTCRAHNVTHVFAVPMLWHTVEKQIMRQAASEGKEKTLMRGVKFCTALQNIAPTLGAWLSRRIMKDVTSRLFGDSVRFCISGGSYIKDSALRLINGLGYPLSNGYGMSEIGITSVELGKRPSAKNKNSAGAPFRSVEYRLNDDGVLEVRGDSICRRMLIDGEEITNDGWFSTGDTARCEDGRYYIIGRCTDAVIGENGENINPDVVEQCFTLDGADSFCVLGLGEREHETLSLVVRLSPYMAGDRVRAVIDLAYAENEKLPMASRVRNFYITYDPLAPETAVKVGRKYLSRAVAGGSVKLIPFAEVKTDTQGAEFDTSSPLAKKVSEIIVSVLGCDADAVGADTHVINDLGADSLQYFTLITRLAEEFSITGYSDTDKYCCTLREFCTYIERHIG